MQMTNEADALRASVADEELVRYVLELRAAPGVPIRHLGAAALRARSRERAESRPAGPELEQVRDRTVGSLNPIPVRVYRTTLEPRPVIVYLHGGGWTIGDLDTHDGLARRIALATDCAVVAVDYRRAPEHQWPIAVQDAANVVTWVLRSEAELRHGGVVAIAGDSAGGNIAALVCLERRDRHLPPLAAQWLAYPNTDLTLSQPSVRENAYGWGLDSDDVHWFVEQWVPDASRRADPDVSPLFERNLTGLPPIVVVTAEHDPLRDEGDAYADLIAFAGGRVVHRMEPGLVHGFLGLGHISPACAAAEARAFADLAALLRP
jgi:acetyl esterase